MSSTPRTWQDPAAPDPDWPAPAPVTTEQTPSPPAPAAETPPPQPSPEQAPDEQTADEQIDPSWAVPDGPPKRPRPRWLTVGAPILALVLVFALVWGLGGFEKRKDLLIDKAPGDRLVTGPFEFTFTKATAQLKTDFDESRYWEVVAIGEGRTTGDEAIAPKYSGDYGMFVARDIDTPQVQGAEGTSIGTGSIMLRASSFTPGLPAQPFTVTFRFDEKYEPDDVIRFGVFQLEFTDTSLIGGEDPTWNNADYVYHLRLPLEELPAEEE